MNLHIVILAAGQGLRMHSKLPKVLHSFAGVPILERIIQTVQKLNPQGIHIVYGHGGDLLPRTLSTYPIHWHEQTKQLGTGHALAQALPDIPDTAKVLVLVSDIPLISEKTLNHFIHMPDGVLKLITARFQDPTGLGRILRNAHSELAGIVEEKDATPEQKIIQEINSGIILSTAKVFKDLLPQLKNDNAQNEYYLTDVINLLAKNKQLMSTCLAEEPEEVMGINDRLQLERLERHYYKKMAQSFMLKGVTIADSSRFDSRGNVNISQDTYIDVDVILEGNVTIGSGCKIGPFSQLKNVTLGNHVEIKAHCTIEDAVIADHCIVGPFARIRPGTSTAEGVHVGNFVEIKNSKQNFSEIFKEVEVDDPSSETNMSKGPNSYNPFNVSKENTSEVLTNIDNEDKLNTTEVVEQKVGEQIVPQGSTNPFDKDNLTKEDLLQMLDRTHGNNAIENARKKLGKDYPKSTIEIKEPPAPWKLWLRTFASPTYYLAFGVLIGGSFLFAWYFSGVTLFTTMAVATLGISLSISGIALLIFGLIKLYEAFFEKETSVQSSQWKHTSTVLGAALLFTLVMVGIVVFSAYIPFLDNFFTHLMNGLVLGFEEWDKILGINLPIASAFSDLVLISGKLLIVLTPALFLNVIRLVNEHTILIRNYPDEEVSSSEEDVRQSELLKVEKNQEKEVELTNVNPPVLSSADNPEGFSENLKKPTDDERNAGSLLNTITQYFK